MPPHIDAVVAIARSGLLLGSVLACLLHVPLYSTAPEGIVACGVGIRMQDAPAKPPRHVLLVDDTVWSGHAMRTYLPVVLAHWPETRVTRAAVYIHPQGQPWVDYWYAYYPGPHYLQWNLFNSGHAERLATDLDGILCDEQTGQPLQLPRRRPVLAIVTGRSERDRASTEAWLARYGIRYKQLIMRPWSTLPPTSDIATWKAEQYRNLPANLFIENDPDQARLIHSLAARPVLCPALGHLLP